MMHPSRRQFLIRSAAGATSLPFLLQAPWLMAADDSRPTEPHFFLFYQMVGAWDVCLAFEPKDRDARDADGERLFDQPYTMSEVRQVGVHQLPPDGMMLRPITDRLAIINGINMEIDNGHIIDAAAAGVQGPRSKNAPFVQAMVAHSHPYVSRCPLPHLFASYGNGFFAGPYGETTVKATPQDIGSILQSERRFVDPRTEVDLLARMHASHADRLPAASRKTFGLYEAATRGVSDLKRRWAARSDQDMPSGDQLNQPGPLGTFLGHLFASGVTGSVTLHSSYMFDTHSRHYDEHPLRQALTDIMAIHGSLEQMPLSDNTSVADRTTFVLLSEYCRTPRLNSFEGKDHNFHTNSLVLFGHNVPAGVWGHSGPDAASKNSHTARPIDFDTGKPSESGSILKMANVWAGLGPVFGTSMSDEFDRSIKPIRFLG